MPEVADQCSLKNVPAELPVYVIGRYGGLTNSKIQLGESGTATREIEVVVSQPLTPLVLVLMAYDPVVWKLKVLPEANIAAIIVGGYYMQAVEGVSSRIPVNYFVHEAGGMCNYFYAYQVGSELDEALLRITSLTGSENIHVLSGPTVGRYYVGPIPTDGKGEIKLKDLVSLSDRPPTGKQALEALVKEGKIRPATRDDIEKWVDKASARYRRYGGNLRVKPQMTEGWTYVVSADFDLPDGLYGANSRSFIIPESRAVPGGPKGHNTFYLIKYGSCLGPGCGE